MKTVNIPKLKIKKGDTVQVMSGNAKGKSGKVLEVIREKQKVIVEGVNIVAKHVKPSASSPNGGIEKKENALHISKVMILDPSTGKPTRVGRKLDSNGKLKRYSKKSGDFLTNE